LTVCNRGPIVLFCKHSAELNVAASSRVLGSRGATVKVRKGGIKRVPRIAVHVFSHRQVGRKGRRTIRCIQYVLCAYYVFVFYFLRLSVRGTCACVRVRVKIAFRTHRCRTINSDAFGKLSGSSRARAPPVVRSRPKRSTTTLRDFFTRISYNTIRLCYYARVR
jgi:hypothetical protein